MFPDIQPPAERGSGRERLSDHSSPTFAGFGDSDGGTLTIELVHGDQSVRTIRVEHAGSFTRTDRGTDRTVRVHGVVRVEDTAARPTE